MRMIWAGLASIVGIYLINLLLIYAFQRQFLYFPDQAVPAASYLDQTGLEAVVIRARPDGELRSLWIEPKSPDSPVILLLHGNAGSHFHRIPIYQTLAGDGAAVLGVGYPGYGGNAGAPSESELFEAAQGNYDWLIRKGITSDRIIIIGESLGSGVAAHLATQNDAAGLVMVAAHSGMAEMAQRQFPIFPARWLVKDSYRTMDYIGRIDMPLFWIHGTSDELIPMAMGQLFFDAAKQPKTAYPIKNAGHNDLWDRGIDMIIRDLASRTTTKKPVP
jgi:pimeloyl-ACP methyl ester carboxylesterase